MVDSKSSRTPEENESMKLTKKNKGQEPNSKKYRGKNTQTKFQGSDPEYDTELKGLCSDLEDYIFYLGTRASEKLFRTMKDLERYLGEIYSNKFHPYVMTKVPSTSPHP